VDEKRLFITTGPCKSTRLRRTLTNTLGNALLQKGRVDEADAHTNKRCKSSPTTWKPTLISAARCSKRKSGRSDCLITNKRLQIKPDIATPTTTWQHADPKGKSGRSDHPFSKALEIKPDYAEVHNNLGEVAAPKGKRG